MQASSIVISRLDAAAAEELERLRQDYARDMGGDARSADTFCRSLLGNPAIFVLGARTAGALVGFAVLFELPEAVYARLCANLDDLFVHREFRGRGIARLLIKEATELGRARGWTHLRWIVPDTDLPAIALYRKLAEEAPWYSFVIRIEKSSSL